MEKSKTNKKSKSLIVMLVAILLCIAVVLGMGGFTYAKYVSSKSVETKTANVAKWGWQIGVNADDLFSDAYALKDSTATVQTKVDYTNSGVGVKATGTASGDTAATEGNYKVVAPGTSGSMTFSISGSAEVRTAIKIATTSDMVTDSTKGTVTTVQLTDTTQNKVVYEPIKWTVTKDEETLVDGVTYAELITKINALSYDSSQTELTGDLANATIVAPTESFTNAGEYTISWEWAFESNNDEYDTILGQIANGDTVEGYTATTEVKFGLTITVEQIQGTKA